MWLLHWQKAPKINDLWLDFCGQNVCKVTVLRSDGRSVCVTENTTNDWSVQLRTVDSARSTQPLTAACIEVTDQGRSIRISGPTERSALMKLYLKQAWRRKINGARTVEWGGWRTTNVGWPWLLKHSQITVWTTGVRFSERAGPSPRNHVQTGCVVHPISCWRPSGGSSPYYKDATASSCRNHIVSRL